MKSIKLIKILVFAMLFTLPLTGQAHDHNFDDQSFRNSNFGPGKKNKRCFGAYTIETVGYTGKVELYPGKSSVRFNSGPNERITNVRCRKGELSFVRNLPDGFSQQLFTGKLRLKQNGRKVIEGQWTYGSDKGDFKMTDNEFRGNTGCLGVYRLKTTRFTAKLVLDGAYSTIHFDGYDREDVVNVKCRAGRVSFTRAVPVQLTEWSPTAQHYEGEITNNGQVRIKGAWTNSTAPDVYIPFTAVLRRKLH